VTSEQKKRGKGVGRKTASRGHSGKRGGPYKERSSFGRRGGLRSRGKRETHADINENMRCLEGFGGRVRPSSLAIERASRLCRTRIIILPKLLEWEVTTRQCDVRGKELGRHMLLAYDKNRSKPGKGTWEKI